MRSLALWMVLCALAGWPVEALANGFIATQIQKTILVPTVAGGVAGHGVHASGQMAPAPACILVRVSVWVVAPDPTKPCQHSGYLPPGGGRGALGGCGVCFPNCFIGCPCSCCKHHLKIVPPDSPQAAFYAGQIANGLPYVEIPDPRDGSWWRRMSQCTQPPF
jgi:hypothetical protein